MVFVVVSGVHSFRGVICMNLGPVIHHYPDAFVSLRIGAECVEVADDQVIDLGGR